MAQADVLQALAHRGRPALEVYLEIMTKRYSGSSPIRKGLEAIASNPAAVAAANSSSFALSRDWWETKVAELCPDVQFVLKSELVQDLIAIDEQSEAIYG